MRAKTAPSPYGTSADTTANHEYGVEDFLAALKAGNLPAVSFLKAPGDMDGHAGYSDPLYEQQFLVRTINAMAGSLDNMFDFNRRCGRALRKKWRERPHRHVTTEGRMA